MIAVDTNVLVRFLVGSGDSPQSAKARRLFEANEIWISLSVLLESEWVLRTSFRLQQEQVLQAFRFLVGLRSVIVQDAATLAKAFDWCGEGLDFADALHLAVAEDVSELVTFDRAFAKSAKRTNSITVRLL